MTEEELVKKIKRDKDIVERFINKTSTTIDNMKKTKEEQQLVLKIIEEKNLLKNILNQFEEWLNEQKNILYRDCGHTQNAMQSCYDKLQKIKEESNKGLTVDEFLDKYAISMED